MLNRAYGCFASDLARRGYNHIDMFEMLDGYQRARREAFQPNTFQYSFGDSGLLQVDTEKMFSKLNISLQTE